jgi:hypothetical protein
MDDLTLFIDAFAGMIITLGLLMWLILLIRNKEDWFK